MKKILMIVPALLLALSLSAGAVAPADPQLDSDRKRYRSEAPVTITLLNQADYTLIFQSPWRIENSAGETVSRFYWADGETELAPGEKRTWVWDQSPNDCGSDGTCTDIGGYVPAGRYTAIVETQDGPAETRFLIGEYFTIGFSSRPKVRFVVFVATQQEIEQMRTEAAAEDKTLIVSGIVRPGRRGYNPDWKFTMGPRSIALGEVFIEVCDGSPYYVQKHRDEWRGQRWCPWSSYVKRVGR
ncbi:MAG: hypothetical protein H0U53_07830 [Actinobacteria bacterium]|nr:hypothetical protein [Actinomycetota bacterium]